MLLILTMAFALSIDAFSVSLILGVVEKNTRYHFIFASLVGILHFVMPILGSITNFIALKKIIINGNKLLGITLFVLAISLIIDLKKEKEDIKKSNLIILALSVSLDSYFAGLGLTSTKGFTVLYFFVFSFFSCIITLVGCRLGKMGKDKLGSLANYLALLFLLILSVKYIFI